MSDPSTVTPGDGPGTSTSSGRGGRSSLVVAGIVALVVVLVAGGAFAAWRTFSGSGPRPTDVLPGSTLGVVSVDLDPSGQQKIEAIQTLRKFPSFREEVGLEEDDDVLQAIFEEFQQQEEACPEVDYADDVAPWIGERFALAAVELGDEPVPALVVQVSDVDAARTGAQALLECGGEDTGGFAIGEDFLVASDTEAHAQQILDDGQENPLSADEEYQRWTDEAGGDGVVELYAATAAAGYVAEAFEDEALGEAASGSEDLTEQLDAFEGAAAVLRFEDGGITFAAAAGAEESYEGAAVGDDVGDLPADTAAALAVAVPEESRERLRELAESPGAGAQGDALGIVSGALSSVGLDFPDDVITVLGETISISLGGEPGATVDTPGEVPLGLLVHGDVPAIEEVVEKLESGAGVSLESLPAFQQSDDEAFVVSTQEEYAEALLADGSLADDDEFQEVVAEADDAQVVLFGQLEEPWLEFIRDNSGGAEEIQDLEVFRAFGFSAWYDGDVGYAEARLALN